MPPTVNTEKADFPFSVLAKAMRKTINDGAMLTRSTNIGTEVLRNAICNYLARSRGIHTEPEQIVIGSGAEYLYSLLIRLLGADKTYAIESPSYRQIENVYRSAGIIPQLLPLGEDGIKRQALQACQAQILHVTPYRSFPSGITASPACRHAYLQWAQKKGRYLIEDDFESEFSLLKKPEETLFSNSENDNVIYMNTFSKTVSPSFRAGYMVLPKPLPFTEKLGFLSCTVPTFIQLVLAELLNNGDFERHINRVRRQLRKNSAAGKKLPIDTVGK